MGNHWVLYQFLVYRPPQKTEHFIANKNASVLQWTETRVQDTFFWKRPLECLRYADRNLGESLQIIPYYDELIFQIPPAQFMASWKSGGVNSPVPPFHS